MHVSDKKIWDFFMEANYNNHATVFPKLIYQISSDRTTTYHGLDNTRAILIKFCVSKSI